MRRRGTILLLALLLGGCRPAETPPATSPGPTTAIGTVPPATTGPTRASPGFGAVDCPDDVTFVMVVVPTCGFLTVPEHHDDPDGPSIQVFVVRIDPPDRMAATDAMVVVGETLGQEIAYGGVVPMAARTGRVVFIVDQRGTGLSRPHLGCPEIRGAARAALAYPTSDVRSRDPIIAAIRACGARLRDSGIDPAAFDLTQSAQDIEALRQALGVVPWNVIGLGSSSRLALEVARVAPAGVRSVVLDSPVLPQGPDPIVAVEASRASLEAFARACADDLDCDAGWPDPLVSLEPIAQALDAEPRTVMVAVDGGSGPIPVVVDGVRYAQAVRALLGAEGGTRLFGILASIEHAPEPNFPPNDIVSSTIAQSDGLCLGYIPTCTRIVEGSLLTIICRDVLPFADVGAAKAAASDLPALARVFANDPFPAACEAWDVPPADPVMGRAMDTSIPVLGMGGVYDPFTGPIAETETEATGLSDATFVEIPHQSYNIFGFRECIRQVRRGWLDALAGPLDTRCFDDIPAPRLVP